MGTPGLNSLALSADIEPENFYTPHKWVRGVISYNSVVFNYDS